MIEIDGSILEGGGQILRISLALSILIDKNIIISNIRSKRSNPGLQNQHMYTSKAVADIFNYNIDNCILNSTKIVLKKKQDNAIKSYNTNISNKYIIDLNGAGSIGLVVQQFLPILLIIKENLYINEGINLKIKGGTLVSYSPSSYYLNDVLFPLFEKFYNTDILLNIIKPGLYPVGGGSSELIINKGVYKYNSINIENKGELKAIILRVIATDNINLNVLEKKVKTLAKDIHKLLKNNSSKIKFN